MQALVLYLELQKEETLRLTKKSQQEESALQDLMEKSSKILLAINDLNPARYSPEVTVYIYERRQSLYDLYEMSLKAIQEQKEILEIVKKELLTQNLKQKQIEKLIEIKLKEKADRQSKQDQKIENELAANMFLRNLVEPKGF